jgi:hypothetical protein
MQKKNLILIFSILILIPLISSVTISDTEITSLGLNSTMRITVAPITFDQLIIEYNAITFYNLSYCSSAFTYSIYNFTSANTTITFPPSCGGGGGGTATNVTTNVTTNTNQPEETSFNILEFLFDNLLFTLIILFVIILFIIKYMEGRWLKR